MEGMGKMIDFSFWKGKKVLITGNTGFKGAWLSIWLSKLGAEIQGYALVPPTQPSIFSEANLEARIPTTIGNILDAELFRKTLDECNPEIVFHMAAQPIVRQSYTDPVGTYMDNVIGTAQVLHTIRQSRSVKAVVVITTDKCYENKEWEWGYREIDTLGGYDPYSSSKACAELVSSSFRSSFFNPKEYGHTHNVALATARAGNVIGGGDWAKDRLVPDIIRSIESKEMVLLRNPHATRPWQHVLEPLYGYLLLAQKLYTKGPEFGEAWNFGPKDTDVKSVVWIVKHLMQLWGVKDGYTIDSNNHPHEAHVLKLDCSKSSSRLKWTPVWDVSNALQKIHEWYAAYAKRNDVFETCISQIDNFEDYLHNTKSEAL